MKVVFISSFSTSSSLKTSQNLLGAAVASTKFAPAMNNTLNPSAKTYVYRGPMVFMPPMEGVCTNFQYGNCSFTDGHRTQDGKLQLHVCQPCLQIHGMLAEHTCGGNHPGHPPGGARKVGAVGCPQQAQHSQTLPTKTTDAQLQSTPCPASHSCSALPPTQYREQCHHCQQTKSQCRCKTYLHEPDFLCDCDECYNFFRLLQFTLDHLEQDVDLLGNYMTWHSKFNNDKTDDECKVCYFDIGGNDIPFCNGCINYFGLCENCQIDICETVPNLCDSCHTYFSRDFTN